MIATFAAQATADLFAGKRIRRWLNIEALAQRKLQLLDSAATLDALRVPPGNRLEALVGERKGQHGIRINDRFRLCCVWSADGVRDVERVDDHGTGGSMNTLPAPRNGLRPVHPGETLREHYLAPLGQSAHALAQALKVPASRINDIVLKRRGVTVDTALRRVRDFGGDVPTWMNLQTAFEVKVAEKELAPRIHKEVLPMAA